MLEISAHTLGWVKLCGFPRSHPKRGEQMALQPQLQTTKDELPCFGFTCTYEVWFNTGVVP